MANLRNIASDDTFQSCSYSPTPKALQINRHFLRQRQIARVKSISLLCRYRSWQRLIGASNLLESRGTIMAKDAKPLEDLNANAMQAVQQTVQQMQGAVDNYFNFIRQTMWSYPLGGTEFGEKLKSYSEKNIATANEYVRKLSEAKDLQEVIRIQTEFMQTQFNAFGEQTKSLGEAFTKAATEAVKTPFQKS